MSAPAAMVDAGMLHLFPELVREHGGDPEMLLRRARIDPAAIGGSGALVEYRAIVHVLQSAAAELSCPDFGLRLGALQDCDKALGPIGVVVRNSQTVGQAIEYCAKHIHAYSLATRTRLEPHRANHHLLRLEILLDAVTDTPQTMEHALMLASQHIIKLTEGAARVREVLFSHEPQSALKISRDFFGCDVKFGQMVNGIVLAEADLRQPIVRPDARIFEMATSFIEARFPNTQPPLRACVRRLVLQYLGGEGCTIERVAEELCLHPRTLQRRLRAEGTSFDDVKDEARRDLALRHITQGDLSLTCVAGKLGYAETSVLTRSCYRWFGATPGQLRRRLRSEVAAAEAAWGLAAPGNAG
jgi:AraC-like DNA-binding protein